LGFLSIRYFFFFRFDLFYVSIPQNKKSQSEEYIVIFNSAFSRKKTPAEAGGLSKFFQKSVTSPKQTKED